MSTNSLRPVHEADQGVYYHTVNDTVRTDAILRAARQMRWQTFRALVPVILTAPGRLYDRLAPSFGIRAAATRRRSS